jgi:hypothetical protein
VKAAWDGSCVLQLATDEGSLFFKAYPARTPGEAEVIRMLEEWWPGDVPRLVADDPAAGWMLMRDWGAGDLLGAPAEELGRAVRRFGEIQRGESGRTGAWRAIGCPERGVAQLEQGMVRWLVDLPGLLVAAGVLTGGERDELAALVDPALSWCSRLPELDVPLVSIHHEDLRDGNVVAVDGHHVFSDWSDTVLSHPFFSVQRFLDFVDPPRGEEPWQWWFDHPQDVTRRVVRDQYLAAWEGVAPTDRLHEAFRLTRRLNPLAVLMRFDAAYDLDTVLVSPPADVAEVARELYDSVLGVARVAAWQTGGRRRGRRRLFRRRAGTR